MSVKPLRVPGPSRSFSLSLALTSASAFGLSLLVAFGTGPGCSSAGDPAPSFSEEDRLLEGLMEDYVTTRFHVYPVESTLAGLPGNDAALGSFSRSDLTRRIAWLNDFHNRLSGLRLTDLSQPAFLDSLWLTSLTKSELFDLETRRVWAFSPSFYAETIRGGIVSLLLAPDLAARTDALGARLDAIPPLLDQARENLGPLSDAARRDGLQSFQICRDLLADLPGRLEERLPSYRVAELAEKSRVATRALQSLVTRLSESAPGPGPGPGPAAAVSASATAGTLGEEGLAQFFLYREMVDWSLDRLLQEADERIDRTTDEITELALESFPDRKLESLLSGPPSGTSPLEGEPVQEVERDEAKVRSFLEARQVEGRPDEPVPVAVVPVPFLSPDQVRLWRPASLASVKDVSLLVSAGNQAMLPRELELLTLGEIAGRYRQYVRQSESRSLLRRVTYSKAMAEAWLARVVQGLVAEGYGGKDPELELLRLQRARLAALRLSAVVRYHARGWSESAVEKEFREKGFLSREAAASEAARVAADPEAGSAALGSLLLDGLARDYRKSHPLTTETELDDVFLAEGLVPIRLIRFRLLGGGE